MEIIKDLEEFESNGYLLESCDHDDEVFDGGFICGKEEGREEGIEQGREEGILDVAKNLIKLNVLIEMEKKATNLSEKVIKTMML